MSTKYLKKKNVEYNKCPHICKIIVRCCIYVICNQLYYIKFLLITFSFDMKNRYRLVYKTTQYPS